MSKLSKIMAGSIACCVALTHTAFAGVSAYSSNPQVSDGDSGAGIFLLLAVGALLLIRSANPPKPAEPPAETTDATE